MKTCSKCKVQKDPSGFSKQKAAKDGLRSQCKACGVKYYQENREAKLAKAAKYYQENHETLVAKSAEYRKANLDKYRAASAKRRAAKLQRTPSWVDFEAIAAVYAEARRLESLDGIPRHVDHIIPLQGELVSGFHIAGNLEILTAHENLSKSNKFVPH